MLQHYPNEEYFHPETIPPISLPQDSLSDIPKFYPFMKQNAKTFWSDFLSGPQFDVDTFGVSRIDDDFWVRDRNQELQGPIVISGPRASLHPPPPLTLRANTFRTTREDDEIDPENFIIGAMCIIDGEPNEETPDEPNLWVAKIIDVFPESMTLHVSYFDTEAEKEKYTVIDPDKKSIATMASVLIPMFTLTKKLAIPVRIRRSAEQLSRARLLIS